MKKDNLFYNYIHYANAILVINILLFIYFKNIFLILPLLFTLFFFRNTKVKFIKDDKTLISPSTNKIISIEKFGDYHKITTYLSPLDHHFMVAPCDCQVLEIIKNPEETDAERVRITLLDKYNNKILLEKVVKNIGAGPFLSKILIDSRIKVNVNVNDNIKQGERIGMIRFGSQMVWYIPTKYKLNFKPKDYITIGSTIANL
jgi:phosphatidylserine decarboxylase